MEASLWRVLSAWPVVKASFKCGVEASRFTEGFLGVKYYSGSTVLVTGSTSVSKTQPLTLEACGFVGEMNSQMTTHVHTQLPREESLGRCHGR